MIYYRIYEALKNRTGLGYGLHGARWNHPGTPMIYAASSVSLAMMEFISIKGPTITTSKWILAGLEVADKLPMLSENGLPIDWNARPASQTTKAFGTSWAINKTSVILKVPSARIPLQSYPEEHNLLINPLNPDFIKAVSVIKLEEIAFNIEGKKF